MIQRHSSRRNRLDQTVLMQRLDGAVSYDRIAGYFRSSLFEVAGEAISKVAGPVRIICNSDLDPQDPSLLPPPPRLHCAAVGARVGRKMRRHWRFRATARCMRR